MDTKPFFEKKHFPALLDFEFSSVFDAIFFSNIFCLTNFFHFSFFF